MLLLPPRGKKQQPIRKGRQSRKDTIARRKRALAATHREAMKKHILILISGDKVSKIVDIQRKLGIGGNLLRRLLDEIKTRGTRTEKKTLDDFLKSENHVRTPTDPRQKELIEWFLRAIKKYKGGHGGYLEARRKELEGQLSNIEDNKRKDEIQMEINAINALLGGL